MVWIIFIILLVLWIVGLVSSYTMGGYIHVLLVVAFIFLIIGLITRKKIINKIFKS